MSRSQSVNGTAVLARMFEQAGHKVTEWQWLSPKLRNEADSIVWFPDDFHPPSEDVRDWLEEWLAADVDRTLIYVGRDFDAAPLYWDKVRDPAAPPAEFAEINRRLAEANRSYLSARGRIPTDPEAQNGEWFTVDDQRDFVEVKDLTGRPQWLEGVDPAKVEIMLNGRLRPGPAAEVLLDSEAGPLVSRIPVEESQIIIVTNGSFLLNFTLVNHEHRKLAVHLIEAVGPARHVFFLESDPGGPRIINEDPAAQLPQGIEIFGVAPGAMWHLVALGILFLLCRLPVFGVPRQIDDEHQSDFGRHVVALGELLGRTKNRTFAMTRLIHFQQAARGDAPCPTHSADKTPNSPKPPAPPSTDSPGDDTLSTSP